MAMSDAGEYSSKWIVDAVTSHIPVQQPASLPPSPRLERHASPRQFPRIIARAASDPMSRAVPEGVSGSERADNIPPRGARNPEYSGDSASAAAFIPQRQSRVMPRISAFPSTPVRTEASDPIPRVAYPGPTSAPRSDPVRIASPEMPQEGVEITRSPASAPPREPAPPASRETPAAGVGTAPPAWLARLSSASATVPQPRAAERPPPLSRRNPASPALASRVSPSQPAADRVAAAVVRPPPGSPALASRVSPREPAGGLRPLGGSPSLPSRSSPPEQSVFPTSPSPTAPGIGVSPTWQARATQDTRAPPPAITQPPANPASVYPASPSPPPTAPGIGASPSWVAHAPASQDTREPSSTRTLESRPPISPPPSTPGWTLPSPRAEQTSPSVNREQKESQRPDAMGPGLARRARPVTSDIQRPPSPTIGSLSPRLIMSTIPPMDLKRSETLPRQAPGDAPHTVARGRSESPLREKVLEACESQIPEELLEPDVTLAPQHSVESHAAIPSHHLVESRAAIPPQHLVGSHAAIPPQHLVGSHAALPPQHLVGSHAALPPQHLVGSHVPRTTSQLPATGMFGTLMIPSSPIRVPSMFTPQTLMEQLSQMFGPQGVPEKQRSVFGAPHTLMGQSGQTVLGEGPSEYRGFPSIWAATREPTGYRATPSLGTVPAGWDVHATPIPGAEPLGAEVCATPTFGAVPVGPESRTPPCVGSTKMEYRGIPSSQASSPTLMEYRAASPGGSPPVPAPQQLVQRPSPPGPPQPGRSERRAHAPGETGSPSVLERTQSPFGAMRTIPMDDRALSPVGATRVLPVDQRSQSPSSVRRPIPVDQRTQSPFGATYVVPINQRTLSPSGTQRVPISQRSQSPVGIARTAARQAQAPYDARPDPMKERAWSPFEARPPPTKHRVQQVLDMTRRREEIALSPRPANRAQRGYIPQRRLPDAHPLPEQPKVATQRRSTEMCVRVPVGSARPMEPVPHVGLRQGQISPYRGQSPNGVPVKLRGVAVREQRVADRQRELLAQRRNQWRTKREAWRLWSAHAVLKRLENEASDVHSGLRALVAKNQTVNPQLYKNASDSGEKPRAIVDLPGSGKLELTAAQNLVMARSRQLRACVQTFFVLEQAVYRRKEDGFHSLDNFGTRSPPISNVPRRRNRRVLHDELNLAGVGKSAGLRVVARTTRRVVLRHLEDAWDRLDYSGPAPNRATSRSAHLPMQQDDGGLSTERSLAEINDEAALAPVADDEHSGDEHSSVHRTVDIKVGPDSEVSDELGPVAVDLDIPEDDDSGFEDGKVEEYDRFSPLEKKRNSEQPEEEKSWSRCADFASRKFFEAGRSYVATVDNAVPLQDKLCLGAHNISEMQSDGAPSRQQCPHCGVGVGSCPPSSRGIEDGDDCIAAVPAYHALPSRSQVARNTLVSDADLCENCGDMAQERNIPKTTEPKPKQKQKQRRRLVSMEERARPPLAGSPQKPITQTQRDRRSGASPKRRKRDSAATSHRMRNVLKSLMDTSPERKALEVKQDDQGEELEPAARTSLLRMTDSSPTMRDVPLPAEGTLPDMPEGPVRDAEPGTRNSLQVLEMSPRQASSSSDSTPAARRSLVRLTKASPAMRDYPLVSEVGFPAMRDSPLGLKETDPVMANGRQTMLRDSPRGPSETEPVSRQTLLCNSPLRPHEADPVARNSRQTLLCNSPLRPDEADPVGRNSRQTILDATWRRTEGVGFSLKRREETSVRPTLLNHTTDSPHIQHYPLWEEAYPTRPSPLKPRKTWSEGHDGGPSERDSDMTISKVPMGRRKYVARGNASDPYSSANDLTDTSFELRNSPYWMGTANSTFFYPADGAESSCGSVSNAGELGVRGQPKLRGGEYNLAADRWTEGQRQSQFEMRIRPSSGDDVETFTASGISLTEYNGVYRRIETTGDDVVYINEVGRYVWKIGEEWHFSQRSQGKSEFVLRAFVVQEQNDEPNARFLPLRKSDVSGATDDIETRGCW